MTPETHLTRTPARRRSLAIGAVAWACLAASLAIAADPAAAARGTTASVKDRTLLVTGTNGADRLALRLAPGTPGILQVDVDANGTADFLFDRSTFEAIAVRARGGRDEVVVDQSGGTFTDERLTIDGGGGADVLRGGDGNEVLVGGGGDDDVDGNRGADTAFLGGGDDRFTWDPGDGSDTVEGERGDDVLAFNGSNASERMSLAANGARARLTRDVGAITMDLDGVEGVDVRALGGVDDIAVGDLAGTDVERAGLDLDATAGGDDAQADTVTANGTAGADRVAVGSSGADVVVSGLSAEVRVKGSAVGDTVAAATLGGDDAIAAGTAIPGQGRIAAVGGEGADTLTYDGTGGADAINLGPNATAVRVTAPASAPVDSAEVERVVVRGRAGADTIAAGNGLATLTQLTIDGGADADVLGGGDGADTLIGAAGDDVVDGNRGNDAAGLGKGDDEFVWDPGDGSDTVEGGRGDDRLTFNGSNASERMSLEANGARARLTRDVGAITMDLDGIEGTTIRALGGTDNVAIGDLTGTDVKSADVDLGVLGGGDDAQADAVTVFGTARADRVAVTRSGAQVVTKGLAATTRVVGSAPATDTLLVSTLAGDDRVAVGPDLGTLIAVLVDLGADE